MTAGTMNLRTMDRAATSGIGSSQWNTLYRVGGIAALSLVIFTFIQAAVYMAWPPPSFEATTAAAHDWYTLLHDNWLAGLMNLDLLMLVDYPISLMVYLALYAALLQTNRSSVTIALALAVTGTASYFAANPAFAMLSLSEQYAAATTEVQRTMLLAAGQTTLAVFEGSAFNASYILIALAGLIMTLTMLQSRTFSRPVAYLGILFYAMNLVPASAGMLGFVLSFTSLIPMIIWLVLVARRLFQLGREERG